jgi:hypothetical protein
LDTVVASTEVKTSLEICKFQGSFLFLQFYLFARVFFTDLKLKFFTWSRNCLAVLRPLSLPRFGAILVTCGKLKKKQIIKRLEMKSFLGFFLLRLTDVYGLS